MLATCVVNGWDTATYRDADHPLQQAMADTLVELAGEPVAATAVDGCGAPVMAVTLAGLARAFGRIAVGERGHPRGAPSPTPSAATRQYLGGTRRDVTALDPRHRGRRSPRTAPSRCMPWGWPTGAASPSRSPTAASAPARSSSPPCCAASGSSPTAYDRLEDAPVLGHGEPVGAVVAVGLVE